MGMSGNTSKLGRALWRTVIVLLPQPGSQDFPLSYQLSLSLLLLESRYFVSPEIQLSGITVAESVLFLEL